MSQFDSSDNPATPADVLRRRLVGAEALYREGSIFCRVRVRRVLANTWGVELSADVIPTKGLMGPWVLSDFSGAWSVLLIDSTSISASYAGWCLCFEPEIVADVVEMAESLADSEADVEAIRYQLGVRMNEREQTLRLANRGLAGISVISRSAIADAGHPCTVSFDSWSRDD